MIRYGFREALAFKGSLRTLHIISLINSATMAMSPGVEVAKRGSLDTLLESVVEFISETTRLNSTKAFLHQSQKMLSELREYEEEEPVLVKYTDNLEELTSSIISALMHDADNLTLYTLESKRYDVNALASNPAELLAEGVFASLKKKISKDFAEACKCIAFETPTAAVCMLMRCMESATYQCHKELLPSEQPPIGRNESNWRQATKDIIATNMLDARNLGFQLDNIREDYRNPTMHGAKSYNIDEAQDLLGNCITALNIIGKILMKAPARQRR